MVLTILINSWIFFEPVAIKQEFPPSYTLLNTELLQKDLESLPTTNCRNILSKTEFQVLESHLLNFIFKKRPKSQQPSADCASSAFSLIQRGEYRRWTLFK